ncbi:MAG: methyltransferase [Treponema sp.]|nr:methyltransferase [Treponema sp.]
MTYSYYGACAPGLEECAAEVLRERFPDSSIPLSLSGALVFETACSYDRLNLFCFNNVFRLIGRVALQKNGAEFREAREPCESRESLERFVRNTLRRRVGEDLISASAAGPGPVNQGFRVIFSLENTPVAVGEDLRGKVEDFIASYSGLRVNRSKPGVEFWFLLRREGAFFMRRLSRHRPWDKLLHQGELPPPLAWVLCQLSNPRPGERVADPFCGYGSIPAARLRHFPPAEFFASDIDRRSLAVTKAKFSGKAAHCCHINRLDVAELPRLIPPASLDSIITDPPWGCYRGSVSGAPEGPGPAEERSVGGLYDLSFRIFAGLLKPGGRVVMLCGRGNEPKTAAERNGFTLVRHIPILLSGKKAAIYVLRIDPCRETDLQFHC